METNRYHSNQAAVLALILGICSGVFLRVASVAIKDSRDFAIVYLSSTAWRHQVDPYRYEVTSKFWSGSNGPPDKIPPWPSVYPICTFPLVAPLTMLTWPQAKLAWMLLNCCGFVLLIYVLLARSEYDLLEWRGTFIISVSLLFFPVWNAIVMGQPVVLCVLCGLLSLGAAESGKRVESGLLLALSLCLKPNLGVIFFVCLFIGREFHIILTGLIGALTVSSVGVINLGLRNFSWISSWLSNIGFLTAEWASVTPAANNPNCIFLINVHYLLYRLIGNRVTVNLVVGVFALMAFMVILSSRNRMRSASGRRTLLSAVLTVVLLVLYHRTSDAVVCLILISYVLLLRNTLYKAFGPVLIPLLVTLMLPGPQILMQLMKNGVVSGDVAASWWWNALVLPHQVISLGVCAIVMLMIMRAERSSDNGDRLEGNAVKDVS